MIHGSYLCGSVQYAYTGELGAITACHCSDCRKAQGTSSVVAAPADTEKFRWKQGEQFVTEYESSPGKKRAFCNRCGTPLYSRRDDSPGVVRLRMGSIDTPTDAVPVAHIYAANLPAWAALDEDWPRYEKMEPGRG
jgi:hypothetical protein